MSTGPGHGIRVSVTSEYIAARSNPDKREFAFAYTVTISNEGAAPAQLLRRHWIITDNLGDVREVEGDGVVGQQPIIQPGQFFRYTSWCMLPTSSGSMRGQYHLTRPNGGPFSADIAPFRLGLPQLLN